MAELGELGELGGLGELGELAELGRLGGLAELGRLGGLGERPTRVAILGAGPAGTAAAFRLAGRPGMHTTLIEREPYVGGLAASFEMAGMRVDLGSHRLHPSCDARVMTDLRRLLGADLTVQRRHGRIRIGGRWVMYPLRPTDVLRSLPLRTSLSLALDATGHQHGSGSGAGAGAGADSFASELYRRFGRTLCDELYFPYARKLWGLAPEEIDAMQAHRRVAARSLGSVAVRALGSLAGRVQTFSYPRGGFGRIPEALASAAKQQGVAVLTGESVRRIRLDGGGPIVIRTSGTSGSEAGSEARSGARSGAGSVECDVCFSTIPVASLLGILDPAPPDEVLQAARKLRSRGIMLVYLAVDIERFSPWDAHYVPDCTFTIARISEPKWYGGGGRPLGRTVLCAELPADPDDALWRCDDQAVVDTVRAELAALDLPLRHEPVECKVLRLPGAYPVYKRGFATHYDTVDDWLEGLEGLVTFGRQGLYVHDNSHHAMEMGYTAADCLGNDGRFDRKTWAAARERWAANVVED